MAIQETRVTIPEMVDMKTWCRKRGWLSAFSGASLLSSGYKSAGVALLWRPWIHLASDPMELIPGRALAAVYHTPCGLMCYGSCYGHTGTSWAKVQQPFLVPRHWSPAHPDWKW